MSYNTNIVMKRDVVFSLKMRRYINISSIFQYFFIFAKYLPLFMICHDLELHKSNHVNRILSYLTLKIIFINSSDSILPDLFLFIFLILIGLFIYLLLSFYKRIGQKTEFYSNSPKSGKEIYSTFLSILIIILVLFNQNIYELLFSLFLCEGKVDINTQKVNLSTDCYNPLRFFTIALCSLIIISLIFINYYFNLIFFQPWFNSDCIIPSIFGDKNYIWIILPLLQGYITLERNIPSDYVYIIRYAIRSIFVIYMINFYFNLRNIIYSNRLSHYIVIFINSFNFFSIIFEFIPYISDQLNDIKFVVIKLFLQGILSFIILFFFITKEKTFLSTHNLKGKKNPHFYENFNKYLFLLCNFETKENQEILEMIINQCFESFITNQHNENNQDISKIFDKTKRFFDVAKFPQDKILEDSNNLNINQNEVDRIEMMRVKMKFSSKTNFNCKFNLISNKLNYFVDFLDGLFIEFLKNERQIEETTIKIIFLYSIFCNMIKRNHVSAFFFLEKISKTKIYKENFLIRIYYAVIKKIICKDHYKFKIQDKEEKEYLKNFYMNIKHYDSLTYHLKESVGSLRNLIFSMNKNNVTLENFTFNLKDVHRVMKCISLEINKHLNEILESLNNNIENNSVINKYKIVNEFIYGVQSEDKIIFQEQKEDSPIFLKEMHENDVFMIVHLDENENIIIDKVENRLLAQLKYENSELIGEDLLIVIPKIIAKYHKNKTTYFTSSNKDFRKLDVFFITKDSYAIPYIMTCIILPMFDGKIQFLSCFEQISKGELKYSNPEEFKTTFTCFLELSRHGQIVTINKEFEKIFGITNELINSSSGDFNFLTKILKIYPERIFNNQTDLQYYETKILFSEVFENLKNLNLEAFREYSLESYYKLINFYKKFNLRRYEKTKLKIIIERRIIDTNDNDFFFTCKINIDQTIPTSISYNKNKKSTVKSMTSMKRIKRITGEKDKKTMFITNEIYKMSKNMLKEGSQLWSGRVSYSDITEMDKMYEGVNPNQIRMLYSENGLWFSDKKSRQFHYKNFIIFTFICILFLIFFVIFFNNIINDFKISLQFNKLITNAINIKFNLLMISFSLLETYVTTNGKMPKFEENNIEIQNEEVYKYLLQISETLYTNEKMLLDVTEEHRAQLFKFVMAKQSYKTIHYDFSIYLRNFTLLESIEWFRNKVTRFESFDNMTFDQIPSEFQDNIRNSLYDINKLKFDKNLATEGDLIIYFLINNFIQKTVPLYDELIKIDQNLLKNLTDSLINKEIIFFSCIFIFLFLICIYLYVYFYSGKTYIYQRYFINFNIIKFFTPYLLYKLKSLEDLMLHYHKENYDYYLGLDYDINIGNIKSSVIRFELENNNLILLNKSNINNDDRSFNSMVPRNLKYLSVLHKMDEVVVKDDFKNINLENNIILTKRNSLFDNKKEERYLTSSHMKLNNFDDNINIQNLNNKNNNLNLQLNYLDTTKNIFTNLINTKEDIFENKIVEMENEEPSIMIDIVEKKPSEKAMIKSHSQNSGAIFMFNSSQNIPSYSIASGGGNLNSFGRMSSIVSNSSANSNFSPKSMINVNNPISPVNKNSHNLRYNSNSSGGNSLKRKDSLKRFENGLKTKLPQNKLELGNKLKINQNENNPKIQSSQNITNPNRKLNKNEVNNLTTTSDNSRINSKNNLLRQEFNTKSPINLLSSQPEETNNNTTTNNNNNLNNMKLFDKKIKKLDDIHINPKHLLGKKSTFYFDFYFVSLVIFLFSLLNAIFFFMTYKHINDVVRINNVSKQSLDMAYSQIEIGVIYIITLIKTKDIYKEINYNTFDYNPKSIFNEKIENYFTIKNSLLSQNHIYDELFPNLNKYEMSLNTEEACRNIYSFGDITIDENLVKNCKTQAGGIYKNGLNLAFDTLVNNIQNNYNEYKKLDFINAKGLVNDENLNVIFKTHSTVMEKNLLNIGVLLKLETEIIENSVFSSLDLYFGLFCALLVILILSYYLVYLFIKRSFDLLIDLERILTNILK